MTLYTCLFALLALLGIGAIQANLTEEQYQGLFAKFAERYNKKYETPEFFEKYKVFKENVNFVNDFNAQKMNTHTVAINQFADMTEKEWEKYKGLNVPKDSEVLEASQPDKALTELKEKESIDWREEGVVNPVYNQGRCGSCYAWSACSAVESARAIAGYPLVQLSVQEAIDCDRATNGCSGGWMTYVFSWMQKSGGNCAAEQYPYRGRVGRCQKCDKVAVLNGYYDLQKQPEETVSKALNIGPVSVAVQSNSRGFMFYKSGIISSQCGRSLDHAITAVGYGKDEKTGLSYYIVRNSWGSNWGEDGYVRIQKGKNMCGIASMASLPKPIPNVAGGDRATSPARRRSRSSSPAPAPNA